MQKVQFDAWSDYLKNPGFRPRTGQRMAFDAAIDAAASGKDSMTVVLPTGYGKTITVLGVYAILRAKAVVDRLVVVVPSDMLRSQWTTIQDCDGAVDGIMRDAQTLGIEISGAVSMERPAAALRRAREGSAEVFVATYQQLTTAKREYVEAIIGLSKSMLASDEAHRAAKDNAWGENLAGLGEAFSIFVSATPERTDKKITVAGDTTTPDKADVFVALDDALKEGAIRRPIARCMHYFVNVVSPESGEVETLTTESLKEDGVTNFEAYARRRQLRFVSKYLSHIINESIAELRYRNALHSGQHQMLVFAMDCTHAAALVDQFNAVAMVESGEDPFADWVGVHRSDEENRAVIARYQSKDPSRRLPCLVQVDKINEGFNNPRVSVLVFLNLIGAPPKLWQQIGRGLRRNFAIPFEEDSCAIFCSADSPVADLIRSFELSALGEFHEESDADTGDWTWDLSKEKPWPEWSKIVDALFDREETVMPSGSLAGVNPRILRAAEAAGFSGSEDAAKLERFLRAFGHDLSTDPKQKAHAVGHATEQAAFKYQASQVKQLVGQTAGLALRIRSASNRGSRAFEKSMLADLCRRIHAQWKRMGRAGHAEATPDELREKYEWCRGVRERMRETGEVPNWLVIV